MEVEGDLTNFVDKLSAVIHMTKDGDSRLHCTSADCVGWQGVDSFNLQQSYIHQSTHLLLFYTNKQFDVQNHTQRVLNITLLCPSQVSAVW